MKSEHNHSNALDSAKRRLPKDETLFTLADLFKIILTFHILDFVRLLIASLERDTCIAARGYDGLAYQPAQKHQHLEYGRLVRMR